MNDVGDFGRRVAERRRELGFSCEELASRAGMHPAYIEMIEHSPASQLTPSALWRLSKALDTSMAALAGGGVLSPPGRSDPVGTATLVALDLSECLELISGGGVGRVVLIEDRGPGAFPVNFRTLDGDVVFRTEPTAAITKAVAAGPVSFEVDHVDDALTEGWSVLLSGEAHLVKSTDELERVKALDVRPWAAGNRECYVRIVPKEVTGRRIRHTPIP